MIAGALLSAALLAGCMAGMATDPPSRLAFSTMASTASPVPASAAVTVVTLNLWHDKQDWPHRQDLIVDALRAEAPDVILLQEVLQDAGLPNQAATLAARLGYHHRFFSVDPPDRARRYGNAILTRVEPLDSGQALLAPLEDYRIAGHVRLGGARPLAVYVTHLHHTDAGAAIRARQVQDLLAFIARTRGDAPVLVGGDFNTRADAPELAALAAGHRDAYAAAHPGQALDTPDHGTLNPQFGHASLRIDHVFVQRDAFRVIDARIILDRPDAGGAWPSDHYGLRVRLQPD